MRGGGADGVELGDVGCVPDEELLCADVSDGQVNDRGVHVEGGAGGVDHDGGCMGGVDERVADEVQEDGREVHDGGSAGGAELDEVHGGVAQDDVREVYNDDEGCKVLGDDEVHGGGAQDDVREAYSDDEGCKVGGDDVGDVHEVRDEVRGGEHRNGEGIFVKKRKRKE